MTKVTMYKSRDGRAHETAAECAEWNLIADLGAVLFKATGVGGRGLVRMRDEDNAFYNSRSLAAKIVKHSPSDAKAIIRTLDGFWTERKADEP